MACLKGVWFQHFWPLTANSLIRSWCRSWSWCSLASETKLLQSFVVGEETRKGLAADTLQTSLKLNTWKKISSGWCLESSEGSVLGVLNNHNPSPTPSPAPFDVSHPGDLSKRLIHIICINRQLPYTFLFLIKASSGRLESGIASSSHRACSGESYKTPTAALTELPVFQTLAYCVPWNYTRKNVLWEIIISARQRPSSGLQYFTFIKAIRGSFRCR